jgi:hypothetical protein
MRDKHLLRIGFFLTTSSYPELFQWSVTNVGRAALLGCSSIRFLLLLFLIALVFSHFGLFRPGYYELHYGTNSYHGKICHR